MFNKQEISYKHLNIWNSMNSNTAQLVKRLGTFKLFHSRSTTQTKNKLYIECFSPSPCTGQRSFDFNLFFSWDNPSVSFY